MRPCLLLTSGFAPSSQLRGLNSLLLLLTPSTSPVSLDVLVGGKIAHRAAHKTRAKNNCRYDVEILDERRVKPLSFGERRAAELAMQARDAREEMKGGRGGAGGAGRGPRALQVRRHFDTSFATLHNLPARPHRKCRVGCGDQRLALMWSLLLLLLPPPAPSSSSSSSLPPTYPSRGSKLAAQGLSRSPGWPRSSRWGLRLSTRR